MVISFNILIIAIEDIIFFKLSKLFYINLKMLKDIISTLLGMLKFENTKPGLLQNIQLF